MREVAAHIPLDIHEVPTGTQVLDWTVPREWNIRDAWIKNARGEKIVDFGRSNLHVMSYSVPVRQRISLAELKTHIHTLPEQPDLIPYRTSYYAENWAFCMSHRQLEALRDETYEVCIDSSLADGHLTYGEYLHRGETEDEFLLSAHVCHPSLANDNCSGMALLTQLAKRISQTRTRYSYRFLFAPGTIGAITWLARNEAHVHRIKHGLVVSMLGDRGGPTYKKSRRAMRRSTGRWSMRCIIRGCRRSSRIFRPMAMTSGNTARPASTCRSGCSSAANTAPFPNITPRPTISISSRPDALSESYRLISDAIGVVEGDRTLLNTVAKGEPQLGRRGLYGAIGGDKDAAAANMAMLWILNLSDGEHSLLDIAERAKLPFAVVRRTAELLETHGLLKPVAT